MTSALHLLLLSFTLLLVRPTTGHGMPALLQQAYYKYREICDPLTTPQTPENAALIMKSAAEALNELGTNLKQMELDNTLDIAARDDMIFFITKSSEKMTEFIPEHEEAMKEFNKFVEEFNGSVGELKETMKEIVEEFTESVEEFKESEKNLDDAITKMNPYVQEFAMKEANYRWVVNEARRKMKDLIAGFERVWTIYDLTKRGNWREAKKSLDRSLKGGAKSSNNNYHAVAMLYNSITKAEEKGLVDEPYATFKEHLGPASEENIGPVFALAYKIIKKGELENNSEFQDAFRRTHAALYVQLGEVIDAQMKKSRAAGRSSARGGYYGKDVRKPAKKRQMRKKRQRGRM